MVGTSEVHRTKHLTPASTRQGEVETTKKAQPISLNGPVGDNET